MNSGLSQAAFEHAVARIYDGALDPELMPAAIGALANATDACGGMLGAYDMCSGDGHAPWIQGLDTSLMPLFERHYVVNPWTELMHREAVVGVPMPSEPFIDRHALRRTGFHRDILAPQGIVSESFQQLRRDGRFTIGLSLMFTVPGRSAMPQVAPARPIGQAPASGLRTDVPLDTLHARPGHGRGGARPPPLRGLRARRAGHDPLRQCPGARGAGRRRRPAQPGPAADGAPQR
jgi:hypothetical protein